MARVFRITSVEGGRQAFKAAWTLFQQMEFGKGFELHLLPLKAKRSLPQNKRMQAIVTELAQSAEINGRRYHRDDWAEYFKREFIGVIELPGGGTRGISTTTLDVEEFTEYMDKIEEWARENGFPLSDS